MISLSDQLSSIARLRSPSLALSNRLEVGMARSDTGFGPEQAMPLLGALLRKPYQVLVGEGIEPAMAAAGYEEIRSAHLPVIQALTENPRGLRSTDLAAHARITKQSMGYLVDHLAKGGYVERARDVGDGRAKVVRLTERGWDLSRVIREAVRQIETDWSDRIGQDRVEQLRQILRDLTVSFDREPIRQRSHGG
jgi:DNA-binding MarR family transcriptional regulator